MFSQRHFSNANEVKCHPEPAAKDLAAAIFCGRDLPGFSRFARSVGPGGKRKVARRKTRQATCLRCVQDDVTFAARIILA
jgi:hypothetical protein